MSLKESLAELHPLLHEAFLATSGSLRAWKHPPEDGDGEKMSYQTWDRPSNAYAALQRFKVSRLEGAFLPESPAKWYRDILANIEFVMNYGCDQPDEANRRINAIFQAREDVRLAHLQADDEPAPKVDPPQQASNTATGGDDERQPISLQEVATLLGIKRNSVRPKDWGFPKPIGKRNGIGGPRDIYDYRELKPILDARFAESGIVLPAAFRDESSV